jgi:hypothetical protein
MVAEGSRGLWRLIHIKPTAFSVLGTRPAVRGRAEHVRSARYFRHQLVPLLPRRIDFNAEVLDRAFDLGMSEQELDGREISQIGKCDSILKKF